MQMQTRIRRRRRRFNVKFFALSLSSLALMIMVAAEGPKLVSLLEKNGEDFSTRVSSRISGMMRLEQVVWEEVGSTNLSQNVTKEVLWETSGLKVGQEMLRIDLAELEKKLLGVPWIESIQIQKKLPSTLLVRYTVHHARAFGMRGGRLWSVASSGRWISPLNTAAQTAASVNDLPVIVNEDSVSTELLWLDTLEKELTPYILTVHEVNYSNEKAKLTALIELRFASQSMKISLVATGAPNRDPLNRLKRVVQYLIKNNILVSSVDLRPGKKVVVNVGKRP